MRNNLRKLKIFRLKKSNKIQRYADIYLLINYRMCFRRASQLSSGVHKIVVATFRTDHALKRKSLTRSVILTNWL